MDSAYIVRWARITRDGVQASKHHVSLNGTSTVCGFAVPDTATIMASTAWIEYTTCYNCAFRLWPAHGPADRVRPAHGEDFPPRRRCEHHLDPASCSACTPTTDPNWPCPNGCVEPHPIVQRYPRCTVFPTHYRPDPASSGHCADGCESVARALRRANPKLHLELADSALVTCYHCSSALCPNCGSVPVIDMLTLCPRCSNSSPDSGT